MKYLITFLLIFSSLWSFSQDDLQSLETNLKNQSGISYVKTAIQLSEGYFSLGEYNESIDRAKKAYREAAKSSDKNLMAVALNRQAKALIQLPRQKRANRTEAASILAQSSKLTKNQALKIDNLEQLRQIAIMRNKKKEAAQLASQISTMKGLAKEQSEPELKDKSEPSGLFSGKRNAIIKAEAAEAENEELNQQVAALEFEKSKLRKKQSQLKYLLRGKEEMIQDMTEEQMKQQLMFFEQERVLDSIVFRGKLDSLRIIQKEMVLQNQTTELAEQEAQLKLQKSERNLLIALALIILIIAIGLFLRFQGIKAHSQILEEKNLIIREEKQRSEELLLNILPAAIADELKDYGFAKTKYYNQATVLFTDFKNFSQISKEMTPERLVKDLDYCFKHFDRICEKYGLEKIKTIGDAYMCAGGLPKPKRGHVYDVIAAAMEMQDFLMNWRLEKAAKKEIFFEARLGIHTGPIIAGVVGSKKFAYDIWGDTVNVASRMETNGEPGKVNISATTYQLVKDKFECEYRGKVPAKNYGEIDMYFVEKSVA